MVEYCSTNKIFVLRKYITANGNGIGTIVMTYESKKPQGSSFDIPASVFQISGLTFRLGRFDFCSTRFMEGKAVSEEYCSTEIPLSNPY